MKRLLLFGALLCQPAFATDLPPPFPILGIGWTLETNLTVSPLRTSSAPVMVDMAARTIAVGADGADFALTVICSNEPVLTVTITGPPGQTNELQWTTDPISGPWQSSNVRWIQGTAPVQYYELAPRNLQFFRVMVR